MPALNLKNAWKLAPRGLVLSVLIVVCGCSAKTPPPVVIAPPRALMDPCPEPEDSGMALELLKNGDTDGAALAHVRYVLDVRDAFGRCNGRLGAMRDYVDGMTEALE